jgi:hypothetical protein
MCLHRQDSPSGFRADELDVVRRLVPHIGEGLRRALLLQAHSGPGGATAGPGVLLLDEDLSVSSMNPQAEHWLAELHDGPLPVSGLPIPVYAAARAGFRSTGPDVPPSSTIRLRTARGEWLTLHASPMRGPNGAGTSVVLEAAPPLQLASLFLDAHGLTAAQSRVAALVLQGRSTGRS